MRWLARAGALLAGVVVVAAMARGEPAPPRRVDLRTGGAWVASSRVGMMTLIDGETAEVVARVEVGAGRGPLVATQAGPVGYAVDGAAGTVVRVDPRTFAAGPAVRVVAGSPGQVAARATGRAVYVFDEDRGRVVVADPADLSVRGGGTSSLADGIRSGLVDADGRLWLLGATSGDLVWFDGRQRHERPAVVDDPAGAELVDAGGSPVLVDRAARRVWALGRSGRPGAGACVDMRVGDGTVRFGGAGGGRRVYAVSGAQGVLRVSDLRTGECTALAQAVAPPGHELGAPVEVDGYVFVPDYRDGTVTVVDVARGRVATTDRPVAEGRFDLFAEEGFVFYNDPETERAGVIHLDGTFSAVQKYNPRNPGDGVDNPPEDAPARPPAAPDRPPTAPTTIPPAGDPRPPERGTTPPFGGAPMTVTTVLRGGSGPQPSAPPGTRPRRPDETTTTTTPTTSTTTTTTTSTTVTTTTTTATTVPTTPTPTPPPDRTDPVPSFGSFTIGRNGFLRTINISMSATDSGSGVDFIRMFFTYTYQCDGDPGPGSGSLDQTWHTPSHTFTDTIGCDVANRSAHNIRVHASITAVDNAGNVGGPVVRDF
jgi:hypothetical protein